MSSPFSATYFSLNLKADNLATLFPAFKFVKLTEAYTKQDCRKKTENAEENVNGLKSHFDFLQSHIWFLCQTFQSKQINLQDLLGAEFPLSYKQKYDYNPHWCNFTSICLESKTL